MPLDPATVRRIAKLARINVTDDQLAPLQAQLQEVDLDGVTPLTGAADMALRMREDRVTDGGIAEQVLANAPDRAGPFFAVPKVVE